jgi:hypothetical protein
MPVGSRLELVADGGIAVEVEVVRVHEQVAGAERSPGMRIKVPVLERAAAALWQGLISVDDPVAPVIPLVAPPAIRAAASEDVDTTVVDAELPSLPAIAAKGRTTMQGTAVVGAPADGTPTEVMPAVDSGAVDGEPSGKKKRSRKKKK